MIFANTFAAIADPILDGNMDLINSPVAWLGIIAYALQIYFDFSGYSDMAIGLGRMFGFHILENFNYPYISKSIKEFWRRWHISLSSWFRDYVYIPLGGNRRGLGRTYVNLMIVFLLTGFWHGSTWSFVLWGVFHGLFLIVERLGFGKILDRAPSIFSWVYTLVAVLIGWVFFRIEAIGDAISYLGIMFSGSWTDSTLVFEYLDREKILVFVLGIVACTPLLKIIIEYIRSKMIVRLELTYNFLSGVVLITMLLYSILFINSGSYSPFIYFRF